MSSEYPNSMLREMLEQRHAAINDLIKGLQSKIGNNVPDEAIISTLILIVKEMGNFYRIFELEINLMTAMQKNIEVVALEAYKTEGDKEGAKVVLDTLRKELENAVVNTSKRWETHSGA